MDPRPAARAAQPLTLPDRVDDLLSWPEVEDVLGGPWLAVHDGRGRCLVRVRDGLGLVERPGQLRARERRGLHRCGYRLERANDLRVWVWVPAQPPPSPTFDVIAGLRRFQQHERAVRRQALRTLRDVLGADVRDVAVVLLPEPEDEWDDLEDECCCSSGHPCGP